jgi:4-diphosphocytidyl-2C-methyl-D-erythritol kinase
VYLLGTGIDNMPIPVDFPFLNTAAFLIVNNKTKLSTKLVYENFKGPFLAQCGLANIGQSLFSNSLQQTAALLEPSISCILTNLKKTSARFCGLAGSGPTCFGCYDSFEKATDASSMIDYYFVKSSRISHLEHFL